MKIVHVLAQNQLTGAEKYAQVLSEFQIRQNHDVWAISDSFHLKFSIKLKYCHLLSISDRSLCSRLKNIFFLRQFIQKHKIEIIHAHSRASSWACFWASLGTKTALVSTLHGRQHNGFSKKIFDVYGQLVTVVCSNIALALQEYFHFSPEKIRLSPNLIETSSLPFIPNSLQADKIVWAMAGRLSGPKGRRVLELLQNVAPVLLEKHPSLVIKILGGSWEHFSLEGKNIFDHLQKKYPERIFYENSYMDFISHLSQVDFVTASGRIALESLAMGKKVFALGEFCYEGPVSLDSFEKCLKTNFGDIGIHSMEGPIEYSLVLKDLEEFLQLKKSKKEEPEEKKNLRKKVEEIFCPKKLSAQIESVYRSAIFLKRVPRWIPILMYHKILERPQEKSPHKIFVTKENFLKHLKFFKKRELTPLHFKDLLDFKYGKRPYEEFPKKPLILTFDDGHQCSLTNTLPLLKQYSFKATFFLLSLNDRPYNYWDVEKGDERTELLNNQQRQELAKSSLVEIAGHARIHRNLTLLSKEEFSQELELSKKELEEEFQRPIEVLAYPFGYSNSDVELTAALANYQYALKTDQGPFRIENNCFRIFRVSIFPQETSFSLWKKTSSWYRMYYDLKKRSRRTKYSKDSYHPIPTPILPLK